MATALDIIRAALAEAEIYGIPEQLADADAAQGLESLNYIVDTWSEEYLYLYSLTQLSLVFPMGGSTGLTIGIGGYFNVARPTRIDVGPGAVTALLSGSPPALPVDVVSAIEWQAIFGVAPGSGVPNKLYYDPQYPLGVFNIAPIPAANYTLLINSWVPLTAFATLTTNYTLAPGIEDALRHELSIVLKPFFSNEAVNPVTIQKAATAKAALMETNMLSRAMLEPKTGTRA